MPSNGKEKAVHFCQAMVHALMVHAASRSPLVSVRVVAFSGGKDLLKVLASNSIDQAKQDMNSMIPAYTTEGGSVICEHP